MQRYTINRDFLENIRQAGGTGKYQEYADAALRGFGVKVTPKGGVTYYYRWSSPNGKHPRKTVGHYPAIAPSVARELAKKMGATLDRSSDDDVTLLTKQAARAVTAERLKAVPTGGEFLTKTYADYFVGKSRNKERAKRTIADIREHFADILGKALNEVSRDDLMQWVTTELARVKKPATASAPAQYMKPATANRKMNALRGLLTNAYERKIIKENPGQGIEKEDEGSGVVRWLKPDERNVGSASRWTNASEASGLTGNASCGPPLS